MVLGTFRVFVIHEAGCLRVGDVGKHFAECFLRCSPPWDFDASGATAASSDMSQKSDSYNSEIDVKLARFAFL